MEDEDQEPATDPNESGTLGQLQSQLADLLDPSTTVEAQSYARKFLDKQLKDPLAGEQQQLYSDLEKNTQAAQEALRAAREKLMARRYNPADRWFALSAALGTPTKTGSAFESIGNSARALQGASARKDEWEDKRDAQGLSYQEQIEALQNKLLMAKLAGLTATRKGDVDLAKESLKTLGRRTQGSAGVQDKAIQAVDRTYAKDYVDWIQGGRPDAEKSFNELAHARDRLRGYSIDANGEKVPTPKEDIMTRALGPTGRVTGVIGALPTIAGVDLGEMAQSIVTPGAADIRQVIEQTVQRSLRPILGAQFTEKEGERLIARVYNPLLQPEVNSQRLDRLINMLAQAKQNKDAAAKYFETHNTLRGFQGKTNYTIDDFISGFDTHPDNTPAGDGDESDNPDDNAPAQEPGGGGDKIIDFKDLPHRAAKPKGFLERLGFAEGGVVPPNMMLVRMPDGSVQAVDKNATQEDLSEQPTDDSAPDEPSEGVEPARRAVYGAGVGAAGAYGARKGVGAATALGDMLPGRKETPAQAKLLRTLEAAGVTPDQWAAMTARANKQGTPAMAVDQGPSSLYSLAESALPQGREQSQEMLDRLEARQQGARGRVNDAINKGLKPDDYFDKEQELKTRLYGDKKAGIPSESSKAYDAANAQFPAVKSKQLTALMDTPAGAKAVKNAMKTMQNKKIPIGAQNPVTGAVTKYSLEFLNQVKIELDDMISKEEKSGATAKGKTLRGLRDNFRNEIDTATTDPATGESPYKAARMQNDTDRSMLKTLQAGRDEFGALQPREVVDKIGKMSFEEKDAYRTGVAQKLYELLDGPYTDINAAKKLVGSPAMTAKLRALFDSPKEFEVFNAALEREMNMFENSRGIMNQKGTYDKRNSPSKVAKVRGSGGEPGIFSPTRWALAYLRRKPEMSDDEATELIKMLKSQTPEELAGLTKSLAPKFGRAAKRVKLRGRAGMAGAALGALYGATSLADDDEEEPAAEPIKKAEGGKVSALKRMIEELKSTSTLDPENMDHTLNNLSMKLGMDRSDITRQVPTLQPPAAEPVAPNVAPPVNARIPAQPEQLQPYALGMDAMMRRLRRVQEGIHMRPDVPPDQAENLQKASQATQLAYDRMMSEPSPNNMTTLTEMVRSLEAQAAPVTRARGGRARAMLKQFGGMTTHA